MLKNRHKTRPLKNKKGRSFIFPFFLVDKNTFYLCIGIVKFRHLTKSDAVIQKQHVTKGSI